MASSILALDLGTTGNKVTLFSTDGQILASACKPYNTSYPKQGWAEQDPEDWWESSCLAIRELIEKGFDPGDVIAVSLSGHMMGCLPVDAGGKPLHPSLIHADGRSETQCSTLQQRLGAERLYQITGNRIAPQYTLPKVLWFKEELGEVFEKTACFLQSKDYLVYQLTGRLGVTDYSDASLSGLMDINRKVWSEEALDALDITSGLLPEVVPAATIVGKVTKDAAQATGLVEGTPVVMGGGDGACATAGAGALAPGEAYNYGGSTSWISMVADSPLIDPEMRVFNLLDLDPSRANVLGTMQCAGSSFQWFADEIGALETDRERQCGCDRFDALSEMAGSVPPGSARLFFLPYLMGERAPIWDSHARGVFFGLSLSHSRAHMSRAVLEGVAYALKSICDVLEELGPQISSLTVIGGMAKGDVFNNILAGVLDKTLLLPANPGEATSRGAAIAAAVACGVLSSYADAKKWVPVESEVRPDSAAAAVYRDYYKFYTGLYPVMKDKFSEAARLP